MIERLKTLFKLGMFRKDFIIVTDRGMYCEGKVLTMFVHLYGMFASELGEETLTNAINNHKNEAMRKYENIRKTTDNQEKE